MAPLCHVSLDAHEVRFVQHVHEVRRAQVCLMLLGSRLCRGTLVGPAVLSRPSCPSYPSCPGILWPREDQPVLAVPLHLAGPYDQLDQGIHGGQRVPLVLPHQEAPSFRCCPLVLEDHVVPVLRLVRVHLDVHVVRQDPCSPAVR